MDRPQPQPELQVLRSKSSPNFQRSSITDACEMVAIRNKKDLHKAAQDLHNIVDVRDRTWHLRTYKQSFVGKQAVAAMVTSGLAGDRAEALKLGNELLCAGYLHHVTHDHTFKCENLYYRFADGLDEGSADEESCSETSGDRVLPGASGKRTNGLFSKTCRLDPVTEAGLICMQHKLEGIALAMQRAAADSGSGLADTSAALRGVDVQVAALSVQLARVSLQQQQQQAQLQALTHLVLLTAALLPLLAMHQSLSLLACVVWGGALLAMWYTTLGRVQDTSLAELRRLEEAGSVQRAQPATARHPPAPPICTTPVGTPLHADVAPGAACDAMEHYPSSHQGEVEHVQTTHADSEQFQEEKATNGMSDADGTLTFAGTSTLENPPALEEFTRSPDRPVIVKFTPFDYQRTLKSLDPNCLPINNGSTIPFETPHFKGEAVLWIKGLPTSPPGLFKGQKRKTLITIQGKFKREVVYNDLVSGQEFFRPLKNIPSMWLVESVLLKVARAISPSMTVGPSSAPSLLVPVISGAQGVCVHRDGDQPSILAAPMDDMTLLHPELRNADGSSVSSTTRRRFFNKASNRLRHRFTPDHIWTFHFYQHVIDCSKLAMDVVYSFELLRYMDGQPLQFMMKELASDSYLMRMEMWHEQMVEQRVREGQQEL